MCYDNREQDDQVSHIRIRLEVAAVECQLVVLISMVVSGLGHGDMVVVLSAVLVSMLVL